MPDALLLTSPRRSDSKEIPDIGRTNELLRQINSSTAPCASASPEVVAELAVEVRVEVRRDKAAASRRGACPNGWNGIIALC
jgi:hypothetical protein